jgi:hypothetical protein
MTETTPRVAIDATTIEMADVLALNRPRVGASSVGACCSVVPGMPALPWCPLSLLYLQQST